MFGAGLIKLRGDPCWRDLTCLDYHYETQPMPNPLSWYFHGRPDGRTAPGSAFNHFAELLVPFGYFLPQPVATIAGTITICSRADFPSGNLSWLNLLTMVLAIRRSTEVSRLLPARQPLSWRLLIHKVSCWLARASCRVAQHSTVRNMLSPRQVMNTSFNPSPGRDLRRVRRASLDSGSRSSWKGPTNASYGPATAGGV